MKKLLFLILVVFTAVNVYSQEMSNDAKILYNSAVKAFQAKRYDSTVIYLDKALTLGKDNRIFMLKAQAFTKLGKYDESNAVIDEVLKVNPKDEKANDLKIANIAAPTDEIFKKGDYENAIIGYKKALAMGPKEQLTAELNAKLTTCFTNPAAEKAKKGDFEGALATIDNAQGVLTPEEIIKQKATIYKNAAATAYQNKEYDKAVGYYEKAIEINKSDLSLVTALVGVLNNYAVELKTAKKIDQATVVLTKSASLNNNESAYFNLINIYLSTKKYDKVIEIADKLISMQKAGAAPYYFKAASLNATTKYNDAIEACKVGEKIETDKNYSPRCAKLRTDIETYLKKSKAAPKK